MQKKRCLKYVTVLLLCVLIVGRIVYVNLVYPSAKMIYVDKVSGNRYEIEIEIADTALYSRTQWIDYMKQHDMVSEAEFYGEYADRVMLYDPDEEYYVAVIDILVTNVGEGKPTYTPDMSLKIEGELEAMRDNTYYTAKVVGKQSKNYMELEQDESFNSKKVYILTDLNKDYVLEYYELGIYQRIKLDFRSV